jgi:uncharacterized protein
MPRPTHFEISADDPDRAARFYEQVFAWKVQKWGGPEGAPDYWLITTGPDDEPGINGGMARRPMGPAAGTTNTVSVPNLEEYADAVTKSGGRVTTEKMTIPGVGWLAYAEDTEGNAFGIIQNDENAGRDG